MDNEIEVQDDVMAAMISVFEDRCKLETGVGRMSLVEWILKINAESQRFREEVRIRADEIISNETDRMQFVNSYFRQRFDQEAQNIYKDRKNKKSKGVKLLTGTIGYRNKPKQFTIVDMEKAVAWSKKPKNNFDIREAGKFDIKKLVDELPVALLEPALLEVKVSCLEKHLKDTGEMPDGCRYTEEENKFYAKPIDGKDILESQKQLEGGE